MKSLSSTRSVILKLVLVKYLLRELSFGNTMSKALKTVWVNMIQLFESDIWSESQILRVLHYHNHLSRFFPDLYFKLGPILSFTSASSSVFFGRSCEGPYFIFPCKYCMRRQIVWGLKTKVTDTLWDINFPFLGATRTWNQFLLYLILLPSAGDTLPNFLDLFQGLRTP